MKQLTVYKSPFNKIRLGKDNDGGYIICEIPEINYELFLSAGISDDISFEEDFCNKYKNVKCYAYDGTINDIKINNSNIKFIKKNIGPTDTNETVNLHNYINENNNLFLKMDIEGAEVEWLNSLSNEQLNKFSQMVIEFHNPFNEIELNMFNKLCENHYIIHFHGNNCCGVRIHNGVTIPNVFECTFLNKKYFKTYPELNTETIPSVLDMKNVIYGEEIYINYPPFVFLK
jgi:hypothetical protein